tara:strand:+ start:291 stop:428 length:138 start_codon:yes stop_codon:yes gene_type:complete
MIYLATTDYLAYLLVRLSNSVRDDDISDITNIVDVIIGFKENNKK